MESLVNLLKRKWWLAGGAALLVVLFAAFGLNRKPAVQYFTTPVGRGDIRDVVEATGTINAVTTVQVGSQVSGTIAKLSADFNSHVKKGQVIAEIDSSLFQGALLQARADLENARANLAAARANLEKAKATAVQAKADYERNQALAKEGVTSQQQLDLARATSESANAQVSAEQATINQAQAQVSQKAAALQVSQTNLSHTIISAPVDGVVVARNVDVGQTVAASLQAPTLFTIAQDLTKMQVYTKTDESDVGQIRPGQKVTFKVDAFPRDTFEGRVSQVRMNATTVQNVVTYDTIIDFDNPDTKLFPGMTAYVSIPVATVQDVVKIPNGALRFKPDMTPVEIRALYAKYGIEGGQGERAESGGNGGGRVLAAAPASPGGQPGGGGDTAPTHGRRLDVAIVWKLKPDNTLEPVQVRTGITDRTFTQMAQALHGSLKEGDLLVTGSNVTRAPSAPGVGGGQRR
jgi:HlyD family secretion protein